MNINNFPSDPINMPPTFYLEVDADIRETLQRNWRRIMTRQSRHNSRQDWYNYRVTREGHQRFPEYLRQVFDDQGTAFKLNLSFGYILRNNETWELQYYHASANNQRVLDEPFLITNRNDLERLIQVLLDIDFINWVRLQRPNTKWIVDWVTNVTFFVTKIPDHPIGRPLILPNYIVFNRAIVPLECDSRTGAVYDDRFCFFRCLALLNGASTKNLRNDSLRYFNQ